MLCFFYEHVFESSSDETLVTCSRISVVIVEYQGSVISQATQAFIPERVDKVAGPGFIRNLTRLVELWLVWEESS